MRKEKKIEDFVREWEGRLEYLKKPEDGVSLITFYYFVLGFENAHIEDGISQCDLARAETLG